MQGCSRIVAQSGDFELRDTPASLTLAIEQHRPDPQAAALVLDMVMSTIMEMCRMHHGASLHAGRVTLRPDEPDCA